MVHVDFVRHLDWDFQMSGYELYKGYHKINQKICVEKNS